MDERQQKLYDYLIRYKLGAFNTIANGRWTNDMVDKSMRDEVRRAGKYIDAVAEEGIRDMWRKGIDDDVTSLSRKEIREVAEEAYFFALSNKQKRMQIAYENRIGINKIIKEEISNFLKRK